MIEIINVSKSFGSQRAVDNISLKIPKGEAVGLLGPNGAGKSTLMKMVAGLIEPDNGRIRSNGRLWPALAYKPERLLFPNNLRVDRYLQLITGVSNIPPSRSEKLIFDCLDQVNLLEAAETPIRNLSKGKRQRLAIAQALVGNPTLLLLDEPSNGLDPTGQQEMNRLIRTLRDAGKTILLSSHRLNEVTQMCSQLVIINHGRVQYQNSMADALALRPYTLIQANKPLTQMAQWLQSLHSGVEVKGNQIILRNEAIQMRKQILTTLLYADYDVQKVEQKRITLAELYAKAVR